MVYTLRSSRSWQDLSLLYNNVSYGGIMYDVKANVDEFVFHSSLNAELKCNNFNTNI